MKIRIASSIALAAAIALGATGCSLFAPVATLDPYAPSDGRDIDLENVAVRNMLLIGDEAGENLNIMFTGVNTGDSTETVTLAFMGEGSQQASADFSVDPGTTVFGLPDGDVPPTLVSIPGAEAGSTVTTFLSTPGSPEIEYEIPVLDGTLPEYRDLVIDASTLTVEEDGAGTAEEATN